MLVVVSADVLGMVTVRLNMSSLCRFVFFFPVQKSYSWLKSMLSFYFVALKTASGSGVIYLCR